MAVMKHQLSENLKAQKKAKSIQAQSGDYTDQNGTLIIKR